MNQSRRALTKRVSFVLIVVMLFSVTINYHSETVNADEQYSGNYTVEFSYNGLQYVMEGSSSVSLSDILDSLSLSGEVIEVDCSDTELFSAELLEDDWVITSHQAFTSEEWMRTVINNNIYVITVTDSTGNYTQEKAVQYAKSLVGTKWDVDNKSYDCVDIIKKYFLEVGQLQYMVQGHAGAYATTAIIPNGWKRKYMSNGYVPQPGDVAVWGFNSYMWNTKLSVGHVGVVVEVSGNNITLVDQDTNTQRAAAYNTYRATDVTCFIHPDFAPAIPDGTPLTKGTANPAIPDGDYIIVNSRNTDSKNQRFYFMDIQGSEKPAKSGTNVALYDNVADSVHDVWTLKYKDGFYTITQMGTDMALDVQGASLKRGANAQVYKSNNTDAQKWVIDWVGNYGFRIRSKRNGWYIYVKDASKTRGANIQLWEANSSTAQVWEFIPYKPEQPIENGRYVLVSAINPSVTLDVSGDSLDVPNNTNVQIWSDGAPQKYNSFDVKKLPNGYYSLIHAASGKSLDVRGGFSNEATWRYANYEIYSIHGGLNQQFAITKQNDGYMIRARCSGLNMDVENGNPANGTNVRQTQYWKGVAAQTWKFVKAEYDVVYDANGGTGAPGGQVKYYKEDLSLSGIVPTRKCHTFKGWSTSENGEAIYQPASLYKSDAKVTLYAAWEESHSWDDGVITVEPEIGKDGLKVYTCLECGETWEEVLPALIPCDADLPIEWTETKPEGIDESLIETKIQYRYSDKETVISENPYMDDATLISTEWIETGKGTINYVNSWPSGFSTSHSLYKEYNNKPKTASETETNKTIVSNSPTGYIYWHWCRNEVTNGPANRLVEYFKTNVYTTFHAFHSTTNAGNKDPNGRNGGDARYFNNGSACKDSYWWIPLQTFKQDWTEYTKEYTYEVWSDWSEWSDEEVVSSDTREVETRTLYRYIGDLDGAHTWDDGIITKEATESSAGEKVFKCLKCGITKTETIPMLEKQGIPGDVNMDTKVNFQDVTTLLKYVKKKPLDKVDLKAVDVDGNGKVNFQDVTVLLKYVKKKVNTIHYDGKAYTR